MSINEFLVYLTGVGVVAVISWLFEGWGWFQGLQGRVKQVVFFLACAIVAIAAQLVIFFVPSAVLEAIAPYFTIIAGLFAYVFLGSGYHKATKLT